MKFESITCPCFLVVILRAAEDLLLAFAVVFALAVAVVFLVVILRAAEDLLLAFALAVAFAVAPEVGPGFSPGTQPQHKTGL